MILKKYFTSKQSLIKFFFKIYLLKIYCVKQFAMFFIIYLFKKFHLNAFYNNNDLHAYNPYNKFINQILKAFYINYHNIQKYINYYKQHNDNLMWYFNKIVNL